MSARAIEILEPDGLGHELLLTWAPWARDDSEEKHSWSVKPRVAKGYWGDPPQEYWIVDKIVAPHRRDKSNYWIVVSRYYLGERSFGEIAREMGVNWPEKRIKMNLLAFCALVEREFVDFREHRG